MSAARSLVGALTGATGRLGRLGGSEKRASIRWTVQRFTIGAALGYALGAFSMAAPTAVMPGSCSVTIDVSGVVALKVTIEVRA